MHFEMDSFNTIAIPSSYSVDFSSSFKFVQLEKRKEIHTNIN